MTEGGSTSQRDDAQTTESAEPPAGMTLLPGSY
jgi:hypothetical protein